MSDDRIRIEIENAIATLTIARPEKLNAFDIDMLKALGSACDTIEADAGVRVAILTGAGKAFCAGGDIKAWGAMSAQDFGHQWVRFGHRVFERLATLRMPLIAAINGHTLGGGLELAAAADIRIAEVQAKIGLPETSLGMVPGWSGTQRLVKRFGAQVVRRMVLGARCLRPRRRGRWDWSMRWRRRELSCPLQRPMRGGLPSAVRRRWKSAS